MWGRVAGSFDAAPHSGEPKPAVFANSTHEHCGLTGCAAAWSGLECRPTTAVLAEAHSIRSVKELAAGLPLGSSALFVLVRRSTPERVLEELAGTGGKILKTSLTHEDEAKLQAALTVAQR